jgi:hypothetical protein
LIYFGDDLPNPKRLLENHLANGNNIFPPQMPQVNLQCKDWLSYHFLSSVYLSLSTCYCERIRNAEMKNKHLSFLLCA